MNLQIVSFHVGIQPPDLFDFSRIRVLDESWKIKQKEPTYPKVDPPRAGVQGRQPPGKRAASGVGALASALK